jgi:hypothetical protein
MYELGACAVPLGLGIRFAGPPALPCRAKDCFVPSGLRQLTARQIVSGFGLLAGCRESPPSHSFLATYLQHSNKYRDEDTFYTAIMRSFEDC